MIIEEDQATADELSEFGKLSQGFNFFVSHLKNSNGFPVLYLPGPQRVAVLRHGPGTFSPLQELELLSMSTCLTSVNSQSLSDSSASSNEPIHEKELANTETPVRTFVVDSHPGTYRGDYRISGSGRRSDRSDPIRKANRQYHGGNYRDI